MKNVLLFSLLILFFLSCTSHSNKNDKLATVDSTIIAVDTNSTSVAQTKPSLASLGIWSVSHYVDEFGETSKDAFIIGSTQGTFSNSATENSNLNVDILIDGESKISIQLFEYAGKNPVKSGVEENYKIKIKSSDSKTAVLYANNFSDRLTLNKKNSKLLSSFMKKGGKLSFSIVEVSEYSSSSYKFDIFETSGYDNALKELRKKID